MTHHTDAELLRDIEEHMRKMWDARLLPAVCWPADLAQRLTQAVRRAPAAPVPLRKPTVAQVTDAIGYHASAWDCVDPRELIDAILMLAAAPQPPEAKASVSNGTFAAPVQMPEPVAYQWLSTDNFRISGGPVSGAYWNKLYTEQQVRELLNAAEAGNGK